jgi:sugar transferase (PEP-CTERM system associated)
LPLALLCLAESAVACASYWLPYRTLLRAAAAANAIAPTFIFGCCVIFGMICMGMFTKRQRTRPAGLFCRVTLSVASGTALAAPLLCLREDGLSLSFVAFAGAMPLCWALLLLTRALVARLPHESRFKRRVLVLGVGARAQQITAQMRRSTDQRGIKVVGFVALNGEPRVIAHDKILPLDCSLSAYALKHRIAEVVVAMDDRRHGFPQRDLLNCRLAGIQVTELASFLEREAGKLCIDVLDPSWLIFGNGFHRGPLRAVFNRLFDICFSAMFLVVAAPMMLVAALFIKSEDGLTAPVLFKQQRVGLGGRHFNVLKLRSMRVDAEGDGKPRWAERGDCRITRVGSVMRKLRIDELPQLLNILRGEMSFVGPRPERPAFVAELSERIPYYDQRHCVKPGLTGWAQLCYPYGAGERDAREKLHYDLFYVKHRGLTFDLLILLQTLEVVLLGKGAR